MSFPFLMLEDIDDCWLEMRGNKPDLGEFNNKKLEEFLKYYENT